MSASGTVTVDGSCNVTVSPADPTILIAETGYVCTNKANAGCCSANTSQVCVLPLPTTISVTISLGTFTATYDPTSQYWLYCGTFFTTLLNTQNTPSSPCLSTKTSGNAGFLIEVDLDAATIAVSTTIDGNGFGSYVTNAYSSCFGRQFPMQQPIHGQRLRVLDVLNLSDCLKRLHSPSGRDDQQRVGVIRALQRYCEHNRRHDRRSLSTSGIVAGQDPGERARRKRPAACGRGPGDG